MPATPTESSDHSRSDAASLVKQTLDDLVPRIEQALDQACEFEPGAPDRLQQAIRYAVLAPGKRLRPALVLMAAEACGGDLKSAMPGAVAVEMIHAYSLIHDDLPAMDDDDLRRGRPTVHIEFDEATAILAGDALQPMAFEHLCNQIDDVACLGRAVAILSRAAGPAHLVGGQVDDLDAESGRLPDGSIVPAELHDRNGDGNANSNAKLDDVCGTSLTEPNPAPTRNEDPAGTRTPGDDTPTRVATREQVLRHLESIHRRKTGALFSASLELGATLVGADKESQNALLAYARDIGLAFQVVDDLLDHTADENQLGKRVGKDADRGKLTYPGLMGLDAARDRAEQLIASARGHLALFGDRAWRLDNLATYVLGRTH